MVTSVAAQADAFGAALAGQPVRLMSSAGRLLPVAVHRWHGAAAEEDSWLLEHCAGPTVDLGCGPGRLVTALLRRGVPTLGVDNSWQAVRECRSRGGVVLHRDVFASLPREGCWQHTLLADGNIGIGGNPAALLRRCTTLLQPGGSVLVEVEPPGTGLWQGLARLQQEHTPTSLGPWFPWAVVGLDALVPLAEQAGLRVGTRHCGLRCFVELRWRTHE